jgi:class 3 adenylate cyclase/tetratricopeptide (TPR) repeat protein
MERSLNPDEVLTPYVPRLLISWLRDTPESRQRDVEGTLAFVDISGFTKMTERLARKGKVGAEEVNDALDGVFRPLLDVAYDYDAGVVKWGGDAVLLLFDGDEHAPRAARAAAEMQRTLRTVGRMSTSSGQVTLRMSLGLHSGVFQFFLVGDLHRELLVAGPGASRTVDMEAIADAGEVALSPETAALLDPKDVGAAKGEARLLRRAPAIESRRADPVPDTTGLEIATCLPAPIRELLLGELVEPEHRPVTAAFIEFRGLDTLLAADGAERVTDDLDELIRVVQHATTRHGVTFFETDISKDGGKIMLIAGAPATTGRDEEAMLRAARQIVDAGCRIPIRIGVNSGRVFAGNFGPPYRRTYSVKGDAVNTAARIMGKAELGEFLATEATLVRSRTAFEHEPRGPFTLKGKAQPLSAFAVGNPQAERRDRGSLPPLIGRDAELAELDRALEAVRAGRGTIVELIGEPGVGKSRLVDELLERGDGFRVLEVACDEYDSSTPYLAVGRALRTVLDVGEHDSPADVAARLRDEVEQRALELLPWLPLLAIPLDVDVGSTPEVDQLEERFRRERLHGALDELLAELMPGPTIVVLDDVHCMDEASAEAVAHVARQLEGRPWLVLVTRREAPGGLALPEELPRVSIRLEMLPPESATALVDAVTEELPLPRHQVEALVAQAGGNPLFLRELVAAVRSGIDELPQSVEALLAAQIDRLPTAARSVLRHAAVLGVTVPRDELDTILTKAGTELTPFLEDELDSFLEADGPESLRFRHALMRDAAYEGLPYRQRRQLHAWAGDAIAASAGDVELEAERLSLHFFHAQRYDDAWRFSRVAAERAVAKYANVEAVDFYRRALESSRRATTAAGAEIAQAWEALGDITDRLGAYEEAGTAYRTARRTLGRDPVREARLLMREAWILEQLGRRVQALRTLGRGLTALRGVEGREAAVQRAELAVWYAWSRYRQGRHRDAIRWCERAIDEAQEVSSRETTAWAYMVLEAVEAEIGVPETIPYGRLALLIYEELGDLPKQASVLVNLGARAYYAGRWDEVRELNDRARALYRLTGDTAALADCSFNIGELLTTQGHLAEAEGYLREAQRVWKAAGSAYGALATSELGRIAYCSGRAEEGLELLEEARKEFERAGSDADVRETDVRLAECLVCAGEPDRALEVVAEVLAIVAASGEVAAVRMPRLERVRGYALLQLDRRDEAQLAFEETVRLGSEAGGEYELALALAGLARLAAHRGNGNAAQLEEESARLLEQLGVVGVPPLALPVPV